MTSDAKKDTMGYNVEMNANVKMVPSVITNRVASVPQDGEDPIVTMSVKMAIMVRNASSLVTVKMMVFVTMSKVANVNLDGEVISANGSARMVSMANTVITHVRHVKMAAIVIT